MEQAMAKQERETRLLREARWDIKGLDTDRAIRDRIKKAEKNG